MTWEIIFAITLLLLSFISFIYEKISNDVTAILVIAITILMISIFPGHNLPKFSDFIRIIENPAPLTIASMFIISSALNKCGAIDQISKFLKKFSKLSYTNVIFLLVFTVGFASAFINNTPVVVMLLPVMLSQAHSMSIKASKLLIPLSYASIFGGTCTLLGTSTNILASGIIQKQGFAPLGMFEISSIGIPLLICGGIYLATIGKHLLPDRETLTSILTEQERKEFISEVFIHEGSNLIGTPIGDSDLYKKPNFNILAVFRNGVTLDNIKDVILKRGDRLLLSANPSGIAQAHNISGIQLNTGNDKGLSTITANEGAIVEAVLTPNSSFVGKTIKKINFLQHYPMVVLAIHRQGRNVRDRIDTLKLELGDTLLLMGTEQSIKKIHAGEELILLDRPPIPSPKTRKKAPLILAILLGVIICASFKLMPIAAATVLGVALIFLTGSLDPKEGYASINWGLLVLIYGMLTLGMLLQVTGASSWIVNSITSGIQGNISLPYQPIVSLVVIYFCTSLFTEILSNNATVVIMIPIGISFAQSMGIDPRPFIIAVCVASSATFATPIGYQTNTYVFSVGGYKFTDFLKVGIPLNLLYMIITCLLVPLIWPF